MNLDLIKLAQEQTGTETGLKQQVIEALRQIYDPEIPLNIYDLGLIYAIRIDGSTVYIKMTLTSPGCPAGPQILGGCQQVVENMEGVDKAEIELTFNPMWSIEKASAEVQALMQEYM